MSAQRKTQAVMFADVSGSSRLYKEQGNTQAKSLIDKTLNATRQVIEQHAGAVVKNIGDEVMARFVSASDACQAALELQRQARRLQLLPMRIGVDYGATLVDAEGDVFGDVVNQAAEVSHIARAGQIVITQAVLKRLNTLMAQQCDAFDQVVLKGAEHTCTVYRLPWEAPAITHSATAVIDLGPLQHTLTGHRLHLSAPEREASFSPEQLPLSFGRDRGQVCWVAHSTRASREHGSIVFRRGKYVLVDHSTNGTYMQIYNQDNVVYLRREQTTLTGHGRISFGLPLDAAGNYVIEFNVVTEPNGPAQ